MTGLNWFWQNSQSQFLSDVWLMRISTPWKRGSCTIQCGSKSWRRILLIEDAFQQSVDWWQLKKSKSLYIILFKEIVGSLLGSWCKSFLSVHRNEFYITYAFIHSNFVIISLCKISLRPYLHIRSNHFHINCFDAVFDSEGEGTMDALGWATTNNSIASLTAVGLPEETVSEFSSHHRLPMRCAFTISTSHPISSTIFHLFVWLQLTRITPTQ